MLHGYGSDENDLFSFASELPPKYAIISLKAPYGLNPHGNAWYAIHFDNLNGKWSDDNQAIKSREMVVSALENQEKSLNFIQAFQGPCKVLEFCK